jgi:hypothetical protein
MQQHPSQQEILGNNLLQMRKQLPNMKASQIHDMLLGLAIPTTNGQVATNGKVKHS